MNETRRTLARRAYRRLRSQRRPAPKYWAVDRRALKEAAKKKAADQKALDKAGATVDFFSELLPVKA